MPIAQEISDMLDVGRKPSQVSSALFFYIENSENRTGVRGVPTERREPCDCKYRCMERVCRSVGIFMSFRSYEHFIGVNTVLFTSFYY